MPKPTVTAILQHPETSRVKFLFGESHKAKPISIEASGSYSAHFLLREMEGNHNSYKE